MRTASAANWRARATGSQNRKPPAALGAVVVGELGGEIAGLRDLATVELGGPTGRTDERTNPRTDQVARSDAEPHPGRTAECCPARLALHRPEINPGAAELISRTGAGLWPATVFRVTTWRGSRAQSLVLGVLPSGLWGRPGSASSKHQRPRTRCPRLSPRLRAVLGRAASRSKCRLRQGRAASRAEPSQCRKKSAALHTGGSHRLPLRACRNSAPLVGICASRLVPGLVKPHPRGKTRAQGSRISGN